LVASIRGANAPLILRTIQEQLNYENKVLKGEAERKPVGSYMNKQEINFIRFLNPVKIVDPYIEELRQEQIKQEEEIRENQAKAQHTVVVIKTNDAAKRDEIINNIKNKGYNIVAHKEAQLNEDQVKEIFLDKINMPNFEEFSKNVTSSTSYVLVLTGENIIQNFNNELNENNADSIKSTLSDDDKNILEASDSEESANREMAFFFPELSPAPASQEKKSGDSADGPTIEQTIAIIKPGVSPEKHKEIHELLKGAGFKISLNKMQQLTPEVATELYKDHAQTEFFNDLITFMSSNEIEINILSKADAIKSLIEIMGPNDPELAKNENPNS
jgi:thioredoxin domain-containing protein 3